MEGREGEGRGREGKKGEGVGEIQFLASGRHRLSYATANCITTVYIKVAGDGKFMRCDCWGGNERIKFIYTKIEKGL